MYQSAFVVEGFNILDVKKLINWFQENGLQRSKAVQLSNFFNYFISTFLKDI
jgi:hypothetical protein